MNALHGALIAVSGGVERRAATRLRQIRRQPLVVPRMRSVFERMPRQRVLLQPRMPGFAQGEDSVEAADVFVQAHESILRAAWYRCGAMRLARMRRSATAALAACRSAC